MGEWHHILMTYELRDGLSLYLDGVKRASDGTGAEFFPHEMESHKYLIGTSMDNALSDNFAKFDLNNLRFWYERKFPDEVSTAYAPTVLDVPEDISHPPEPCAVDETFWTLIAGLVLVICLLSISGGFMGCKYYKNMVDAEKYRYQEARRSRSKSLKRRDSDTKSLISRDSVRSHDSVSSHDSAKSSGKRNSDYVNKTTSSRKGTQKVRPPLNIDKIGVSNITSDYGLKTETKIADDLVRSIQRRGSKDGKF